MFPASGDERRTSVPSQQVTKLKWCPNQMSLPSAAWKGDPSLLIVSSQGLDFGVFSGNRLYVEVGTHPV